MPYILWKHKPSVMLNSYSSGDELFEVLSDFHLVERQGIYSTSGTPFINAAMWIVTRVTELNGLCILLWHLMAPNHYLNQCWLIISEGQWHQSDGNFTKNNSPINLTENFENEKFRPLQWRHNGHDGVSNHQPHLCLLNRLVRRRSKKTSKLRVTGLCAGNAPVTSEFPAQMASNAENVSIWWRHHAQIEASAASVVCVC